MDDERIATQRNRPFWKTVFPVDTILLEFHIPVKIFQNQLYYYYTLFIPVKNKKENLTVSISATILL